MKKTDDLITHGKGTRKVRKPLPLIISILMILLAAVLSCVLVVANIFAHRYADLISVHLNQPQTKVVSHSNKKTEHFISKYASKEERTKALKALGADILREGSTLLFNNNNALPLKASAKITALGQNFVDPVYGGGGAGSIDTKQAVNFETAFKKVGLQVNPTVTEFYKTGAGKEYRKTIPDAFGRGELTVNEVPSHVYPDDVTKSFKKYSDAAVVILGRTGSETTDISTKPLATGFTYLQLDKNEQDLLEMAHKNFKTVIVLLNTLNPVELGPLVDKKVDAALWIGGLGQTGALGVADVLIGQVNPSGRLPDTYAYDSLSAPSHANFGNYTIKNSKIDRANTYMAYLEGIYVGYRYYETRYEDHVLGNEPSDRFDYAHQVQYSFGYGLSYTNFEWSNFTQSQNKDSFEFTITVKNTGRMAGKDVVQLYMQSPYIQYDREQGIEKPAVELVGYAKTDVIKPDHSQKVSISVPLEVMKSYDAHGEGTYIVEAGDYYFSAGTNAHDGLNNILAAKGKTTDNGMTSEGHKNFVHREIVRHTDTKTYAVSQATREKIANQFDHADITQYDSSTKYLSRSDWQTTWPQTFAEGEWTAPSQLVKDLQIDTTSSKPKAPVKTGIVDKKVGKLKISMLMNTPLSDPVWMTAIQQMSVKELDELVRIGGYATKHVDSTQLPATVDKDGPAGISGTLVGGESGIGYAPEVVIAATWNTNLAKLFGQAIGEESIALKVPIWYGAAANIHRSPYSGRNFEYFSEDAYISGAMNSAIVAGARSRGTIATVKHFALNDQETNRIGGAIFANEQSIRELYLKPFEMSVRDGGALGIMASMNRVGARWTGGNKALMTNVLRGEWGFEGFVVTDQASFSAFAYEDLREGLEAGTDLWLNSDASLWKLSQSDMTEDVIANMQKAAKHISFAVSRSNAMNGLSSDSTIQRITPLWMWISYVIDVAIGLIIFALLWFAIRSIKLRVTARRVKAIRKDQ